MEDPGLQKARDAAGGKNANLAKLLGVTESAVSQWKRVPYQRAVEIEEKTGGRVTRHDMRPDVFGAVPKADGTSNGVHGALTREDGKVERPAAPFRKSPAV